MFKMLQRERPDVAAIADTIDLSKPTGFNSDSSSSGSSSSSSSDESSDNEERKYRSKRYSRIPKTFLYYFIALDKAFFCFSAK